MPSKVKVDNFANEVVKAMKQYTDEVQEAIFEEVSNVADEGQQKLKMLRQPEATKSGTTQHISNRRSWAKYSNSWAVTKKEGTNFINCTIHNKKYYRLTHLLEYGHATRDGNRTREFTHIEPISAECEKRIENNIPKIIKKGGKL